jgi:hypothetical protein
MSAPPRDRAAMDDEEQHRDEEKMGDERHIRDEEKMEEPPSDANTMVEKMVEEPPSDANTMVEKNANESDVEPAHVPEPEDGLDPDEYPKGLQFTFILLALMLSVFIVALDLVCRAPASHLTDMYADSACRPSLQRLSPRLRMTSTAFPR